MIDAALRLAVEEALKQCEPGLERPLRNAMLAVLNGEHERLRAAFNELRPLCRECGEPGTRQFRSGELTFWLCDTTNYHHGTRFYSGVQIPQPALRDYLFERYGAAEPERCKCKPETSTPFCRRCEGDGWVLPNSPPAETESAE